MNPIRLLLIEDSENDARLLLRSLERQGLQVTSRRVETKEAVEAAWAEGGWDLVISDYQLPRFDGMEALHRIRARDLDIPFLMVSGKVGEELAVAVMRAGANDFLLKDQLSRLGPAIERELRETETRRTQRLYEEERRRLHMAISQSPDAILITDPKGAIVYANPALEGISGYSLVELMGQNPRIFQSGRQDASFYQAIWDTLTKGEIWRGLFVNQRKDGQLWEAEASIAPVLDAEERLAAYVCTQRDVTHERLLQSQLEQSQRLEAIGVLAAGIAHDFNNILMPILAHAEMALNRSDLDPALRKDFEIIQLSAHRAANLTKQVLGFSRAQTRESHDIELHCLVGESLKLLRAAIPSTIQFHVALDPASGYVRGDPTQFHQIVLNLCSNAAHAMRGGTGVLSVSLERTNLPETSCVMGLPLPRGEYVTLVVSDTGHGMMPDTLSRIFLPFFTTKGPAEGSGLGLSIVLGVVQGLGGGIQVESEPGRGTTFRLFLPSQQSVPSTSQTDAPPPAHGTERILLLDDDTTILAVVESMLAILGYHVVAMARPEAALDRFQADPAAFDLLMTDLTMPGMTGLDLMDRARSIRPGLRAVLMTGNLNLKGAQESDSGQPDGILTKPFTIQDMADMIRKVLDA
jgi:two-component system, cell cycle sensor histidine kinase and response regulator CckA